MSLSPVLGRRPTKTKRTTLVDISIKTGNIFILVTAWNS